MKIVRLFPVLLLLVSCGTGEEPRKKWLGRVAFSVSCAPEAQSKFEEGVARLHHMMYAEAERTFNEVAELDPECAMAHWGVAMTLFHPLWPGRPDEETLRKGAAAVERARALGPPTEREKAYIDAAAAFYEDWSGIDHAARIAAWERMQEQVHLAYPDDLDAAALYALAHLATAPASDKTLGHQKKAGEILEGLHKRIPTHPGAIHYMIHAYDNPQLASRAEAVARLYDSVGPDVPHALHMPTHIFVRLGQWQDSISWNRRSAAAALRHSAEGETSLHYAHAMDYLIYAYLQGGWDRRAKSVLDQMAKRGNYQDDFASAYALAAAPARYCLERGAWDDAAALEARAPADFPWDKYPATEAITQFARGLGAARSGSAAAARGAVERLEALHGSLSDPYWAVLVEAQRKAVAAWIAEADGEKDEALKLMREAADLEDSVDKHPVTPGAVLPMRELLGDMLIDLDRPAEALEAYETCLAGSPRRHNSLYGAGLAAELAGDEDKANKHYSEFVELNATSDGKRPALKQAKLYLRGIRR